MVDKKVEQILDVFGMRELADVPIHHLSLGQKRRLAWRGAVERVAVAKEWMLNRGLPEVAKHLEQLKEPADIIQAAIDHVVSFRNQHPEWFTLLVSLWLEQAKCQLGNRIGWDLQRDAVWDLPGIG